LTTFRKLETRRANGKFAVFGTDEFEASIRAEVEAHRLDRIDMLGETRTGGVLAAVQRWARELT
jgi:hypothetical protein